MTVTGAPVHNEPFDSDEAHYQHHRDLETGSLSADYAAILGQPGIADGGVITSDPLPVLFSPLSDAWDDGPYWTVYYSDDDAGTTTAQWDFEGGGDPARRAELEMLFTQTPTDSLAYHKLVARSGPLVAGGAHVEAVTSAAVDGSSNEATLAVYAPAATWDVYANDDHVLMESFPIVAANEQQLLNFSDATAGSITFNFDGNDIGPLAFNASQVAMQAAFDLALGANQVTVNATGGTLAGVDFVTFKTGGDYEFAPQPAITIASSTLTGPGSPYWGIERIVVGRVAQTDVQAVWYSATTDDVCHQIGASGELGFFEAEPIAKPTGVAVTAAAIHAVLVSYGLIGA